VSLVEEVDARLKKIRWQQEIARRGQERRQDVSPELADALRNEIRAALDAGGQPFDVNVARRVYDLAMAARDMCVAASTSVKEAVDQIKETNGPMESLQDPDAPEPAAQAAETFGARILRELIAIVPAMMRQGGGDDPRGLVHAIAEARSRGMSDVADELERKLLGKALSGPRPVDLAVTAIRYGSFEHGFSDGKQNLQPAVDDPDYKAGYLRGTEERYLAAAQEAVEEDHGAAIARDVRLGRTSQEIRDEIIAKVGMMGAARTPEMQARHDAAVERERAAAQEPDEDPRVVGYQGGPNIPASRRVLDHGGRSFELRTLGRLDDLNVYVCGCGRPIRQFDKDALDCPQRPPTLVTIGYEPLVGSLLYGDRAP